MQATCSTGEHTGLWYEVHSRPILPFSDHVYQELITEKHLSFETSRKEIRRSNKVLYRYDEFENAVRSISYKKIMIFVDNSGADIVLGVIPFAVRLLRTLVA